MKREARVVLSISLALLTLSILPPPIQAAQPGLTFTAQNYLWTITTPPPIFINGAKFGPDNKAGIAYTFEPNGTVNYQDSQGASFTISPLTINWGNLTGNIPIPFGGLFFNATMVEYNLTFTFLTNTISLLIFYRAIPGTLDLSVTITGSLSTALGILGEGFSGNKALQGPRLVNGTLQGRSAFSGDEGYDWSDTAKLNPQWNDAAKTVQWPIGASFFLDPVTVDAFSSVATSSSGASNTVTLSTNNAIDTLVVWTDLNGIQVISSITDTANLPWTQRFASPFFSGIGRSYEYYATTSAVLSSDTITITATSSEAQGVSIMVVAYTGVYQPAAFDANSGVPFSLESSCVTCSLAVTTGAADLLFSDISANSPSAPTVGSGPNVCTMTLTTSATSSLTSLSSGTFQQLSPGTCTVSWQSNAPTIMILDAFCPPGGCTSPGSGPGSNGGVGGGKDPISMVLSQPPAVQGILGGLSLAVLLILFAGAISAQRRERRGF